MWRLFFFSVQSDIKTLLLWRGEGGGCVALHRLGSLFIEMEEEGRKNKYTTASKHLSCLPGCDVSKYCLSRKWLNWDEAVGMAISQYEELMPVFTAFFLPYGNGLNIQLSYTEEGFSGGEICPWILTVGVVNFKSSHRIITASIIYDTHYH